VNDLDILAHPAGVTHLHKVIQECPNLPYGRLASSRPPATALLHADRATSLEATYEPEDKAGFWTAGFS